MTRRRMLLSMGLATLLFSLVICGGLQAKETYRIQSGDTLAGIARRTGLTVAQLKAANQIKGSALKAGQTLVIPTAKAKGVSRAKSSPPQRVEHYVVKKKDTLTAIARRTGVTVEELQRINALSGSALKVGQRLALRKPGPLEALDPSEAEFEVDEPEPTAANAVLQTPEQAWAEIERRKKDSDALLGKWSSPEEPKLLVKAAMGFLGAPYRLGGFSAKGIDCSGLVKKIYQLFDIDLPRTAFEQSLVGMRIARSDLSEGDLIFFNTRRRFGHVGIYIGNNEFVHAASRKRGVRIDSLDTPYFKKRFISAVRLKGGDEGL